jgi:hypothetical protein
MMRLLFIFGLAMLVKNSMAQDSWKVKADKIDPGNYYGITVAPFTKIPACLYQNKTPLHT